MSLMLAGITTVAIARLITTSGRMVRVAEDRHGDAQIDATLRWIHRSFDRSEPAAVLGTDGGGSARVDLWIDGDLFRIRLAGARLELVPQIGPADPEVLLEGVQGFTWSDPPGEPPVLSIVHDGRTMQRQLYSLRRCPNPVTGLREQAWW